MKTNFSKKILKISTIAIFSVFVSLFFLSSNPKETFSFQEAPKAKTDTETTSYIDDDGYEQNITDITTTYTYERSGKEAYKTINRTRTYTDSEGVSHTFNSDFTNRNYKNKEGGWSEEEEIINKDNEEKVNNKTEKYIYTLLQPLPGANKTLSNDVTIEEYLTWAFRFALALAGFLAVMMIVIGGVEYIISGANEKMRGEAHSRISNAIYGLVLALVSYLVLYTINPNLVDFKNNCFFKDCDKETRWDEDSENNIGDFNGTITEDGDMPS